MRKLRSSSGGFRGSGAAANHFFEIFYDGQTQSDSASSNFQIVVRNQGGVIPEPATMF